MGEGVGEGTGGGDLPVKYWRFGGEGWGVGGGFAPARRRRGELGGC